MISHPVSSGPSTDQSRRASSLVRKKSPFRVPTRTLTPTTGILAMGGKGDRAGRCELFDLLLGVAGLGEHLRRVRAELGRRRAMDDPLAVDRDGKRRHA